MIKKKLRERFLLLRNCLHERKEREKEMVSSLLSDERIREAQTISVFVSFGSEIDTHQLISSLLEKGKRVVVPFVRDDEMLMKQIESLDDLIETNKYGIKEPSSRMPTVLREEIDVMIVPALAFDEKGYRLGYGKGYYDRYLKDSSVYTVGIGFKEQLTTQIQADEFDVPLSEVRLF